MILWYLLVKSVGFRSALSKLQSISSKDTSNLGITLIKQRLTELGVSPQSYRISDGSGLARHNLVAPTALTQRMS